MTEQRTRIKLCGISRVEDVIAAVDAGADAIGLVFHAGSVRYLTPDAAARLIEAVPPFVAMVGLFVNATPAQVAETVAQAPVSLLQFHGDESVEQCTLSAEAAKRPFIRAVRVKPGMTGADLLKCEQSYRAAGKWFAGLLLDTWVDGYGGSGKVFDWSLIPEELAPRVVLSGGLSAQNVADAVGRVRPYAVDVSSGIEREKGIKDAARMHDFVRAVRRANAADS